MFKCVQKRLGARKNNKFWPFLDQTGQSVCTLISTCILCIKLMTNLPAGASLGFRHLHFIVQRSTTRFVPNIRSANTDAKPKVSNPIAHHGYVSQ